MRKHMRLEDYMPMEQVRAGLSEQAGEATKKEFFDGTPDEKPLKHFKGGFHPKRFIPEHHNILEQNRYEYKGDQQVEDRKFYHYKREQSMPGAPKYKVTVRHDGAWMAEAPGHPPIMGLGIEDLAKYLTARTAGLTKPDPREKLNQKPGAKKPAPRVAAGASPVATAMKAVQAALINQFYAGGPGSGCNPSAGKCGRPSSGMGSPSERALSKEKTPSKTVSDRIKDKTKNEKVDRRTLRNFDKEKLMSKEWDDLPSQAQKHLSQWGNDKESWNGADTDTRLDRMEESGLGITIRKTYEKRTK